MTSGDLDALAIAREQLRHLADGRHLDDPQFRLQLGLLAAQIALAERLPADLPLPADLWQEQQIPHPPVTVGEWDLPTIQRFLEGLPDTGMKTLRALVAEGGSATPARIKELIGMKSLSGVKSAQQNAFRLMPSQPRPPGWLIEKKHTNNNQDATIERYFVRSALLPLVAEALDQIDRDIR
ncbi:hypothetical protein [Nocardia alba]|uniref:hypothetical protein n=1 Tax=Nocardia alba TaxID=225051 RepID=UPI000833B370|nr:hypothetical protein [Nocardia alba]